jgi:hypothetical protein
MLNSSASSALVCSPGAVQRDEVGLLAGAELGLLAAQPALGAGDVHALAGAHPDQVGLELRSWPGR